MWLNVPRVGQKIIDSLRVGDSVIVTERPSVINKGSAVTCCASRAKIKVNMHVIYIVVPSTGQQFQAMHVTRVQ
jgi:hypothetical protein